MIYRPKFLSQIGVMLTFTIAKYSSYSFCSACEYIGYHGNFKNKSVTFSFKQVEEEGLFAGGDIEDAVWDYCQKHLVITRD